MNFSSLDIGSFIGSTKKNYRSDIDGLRAVAIISVVAFHAFPDIFIGGFVGVDIFFVISGFLISRIIYIDLCRDSFSFIGFYQRRIKRIFPALLLVFIAVMVFGWFAFLGDEYKQLCKHIMGGAGFISNFLFWKESGYFDSSAYTKPLLHLWSLGVEEQYYLLWPVLLWASWKTRFNLLALSVLVSFSSFILNVYMVQRDAVSAFYLPQTRVWELALGSVLAHLEIFDSKALRNFKRSTNAWLCNFSFLCAPDRAIYFFRSRRSLIGAVLIIVGIAEIDRGKSFPGWWALLPTVGTFLVISAGNQAWINRVVLSNPLLTWFGLISYPLYLWHWPLLTLAHILESGTPSPKIRIFTIFLGVLLSWITYKYVEKPFRSKRYDAKKSIILLALMICVGVIGSLVYFRDGLPFRLKSFMDVNNQFLAGGPDYISKIDSCKKEYPDFVLGGYCIKQKPIQPTILLLGDSHSGRLYAGLEYLTRGSSENVMAIAGGACLPFINIATNNQASPNLCTKSMNAALSFSENSDSIKTIVLAARGPLYLSGFGYRDGNDEVSHHPILSLTDKPEISDREIVYITALKRTLNRLVASNKKIIFVLDVPELGFDPRSCVDSRPLLLMSRKRMPCAVSRGEFDERNSQYRRLVLSNLVYYPSVKIYDPSAKLCDREWCWALKGGRLLYRDDDHLSIDGSKYLAGDLMKVIQALN